MAEKIDELSFEVSKVSGSGEAPHKHQTLRPIDLVHLAKYTMGDTELEAEILGMFAKQSQVYFGQLEKAASAKEWQMAAHTLKGSARSVGACHVAGLAKEAEKLPDDAASDDRQAFLAKMRDELDQVQNYIDNLLHEKAS